METYQTIDDFIKRNVALRLSNSNIIEKSLDILIKNSRSFHDKSWLWYENKNHKIKT